MKHTAPPPGCIFDYIQYDRKTGFFTWIKCVGGSSSVGKRAGFIDYEGYVRIRFMGVRYAGHSLAWLHETGEWIVAGIDHKNLVKSDNSFENLRRATRSQNAINAAKLPNTSSRFKGVTWLTKSKSWQAQIQSDGRHRHIGTFKSEAEAAEAYRQAALILHGEFSRFE